MKNTEQVCSLVGQVEGFWQPESFCPPRPSGSSLDQNSPAPFSIGQGARLLPRLIRGVGGMLAVTLMSFFFSSCSPAPAPGLQARPTPSAEVKQEGDKFVITDRQTGSQIIFGATQALHESFPTDLPLYPQAVVNNFFVSDGKLVTICFTEKSLDEVRAFFLEGSPLQEKGWEIQETQNKGKGTRIRIRKGERTGAISLSESKNPQGTYVSYLTMLDS